MAHYGPQSQTRAVLGEKERLARRLLLQGLTSYQIRTQLRCSAAFLRRVKNDLAQEASEDSCALAR